MSHDGNCKERNDALILDRKKEKKSVLKRDD